MVEGLQSGLVAIYFVTLGVVYEAKRIWIRGGLRLELSSRCDAESVPSRVGLFPSQQKMTIRTPKHVTSDVI